MDIEKKRRPGRALGAARRDLAKTIICAYYNEECFQNLPTRLKLAIQELCPAGCREVPRYEKMAVRKRAVL